MVGLQFSVFSSTAQVDAIEIPNVPLETFQLLVQSSALHNHFESYLEPLLQRGDITKSLRF